MTISNYLNLNGYSQWKEALSDTESRAIFQQDAQHTVSVGTIDTNEIRRWQELHHADNPELSAMWDEFIFHPENFGDSVRFVKLNGTDLSEAEDATLADYLEANRAGGVNTNSYANGQLKYTDNVVAIVSENALMAQFEADMPTGHLWWRNGDGAEKGIDRTSNINMDLKDGINKTRYWFDFIDKWAALNKPQFEGNSLRAYEQLAREESKPMANSVISRSQLEQFKNNVLADPASPLAGNSHSGYAYYSITQMLAYMDEKGRTDALDTMTLSEVYDIPATLNA